MQLRKMQGTYGIYKYPPAATVKLWPQLLPLTEPSGASLFNLSVTDKELSIVTSAPLAAVEGYAFHAETGYAAFGIVGNLDFGLVGILSKITGALAEAEIPVFAISTYDTDYVLVKEENKEKALTALQGKGYSLA
ncbi:hypothetical protein HK101_008368 [Irineochytrium annulatum]|nr:hypothetical protein HK101_008368 [Irineochytrium annulatum]